MSGANWMDLLADAQSTGTYAPIPDGDYDLKVIEAEARMSANGKPMYKIKAEVQSGPHAKRLVWDNLVISKESPGALRYFFRKMAALGLDETFFAKGPDDNMIVSAITNRSFRAKIGPSTGNSTKPGNEIKEYYPAVAGAQAAVPAPAAYAAPAPAVAAPPAPAAPPAAPAPAASPWETAAPAPAPFPPAPPAPGGPVAPPAPPF